MSELTETHGGILMFLLAAAWGPLLGAAVYSVRVRRRRRPVKVGTLVLSACLAGAVLGLILAAAFGIRGLEEDGRELWAGVLLGAAEGFVAGAAIALLTQVRRFVGGLWFDTRRARSERFRERR